MTKIIIIASLMVVGLQVTICAQSVSEELTNELNFIFKNSSIVGFGTAVYTKDTLLYSNGFGVASKKDHRKYTTNTIQKIASISKLLLGVSVMKAQELGLFNLDDNVNDYLPFTLSNPFFPEEIITIRHLASHTSGLAKLPKYDMKALYTPTKIPKITEEVFNKIFKKINTNKELRLEEFLTNLYSIDGKWYRKMNFMKTAPGVKAEYSNSGASLLALIIQKSSGMTYADFVQKYIINPLGLEHSKFDFQQSETKHESSEYYHAGLDIPNDYKLLLFPAGGFESTIADFYVFMRVVAADLDDDRNILSKESVVEMLKPQFDTTHGILWEVYPDGYIGHRGDMLGTTSFAYYNVKKDIGYLLFCNTAGTKTLDKEINDIRTTLKNYFDKLLSYHE